MNLNTITYIQSESEFNRASKMGFWEVVRSLFTRRDVGLVSFNEVVSRSRYERTADLGVQDVPLSKIVGSAGRAKEFTRHFLPRVHDHNIKERWRNIYTLAVTGVGFPPIELYKLGDFYFVADGHHRVSVATYLKWDTIQAHVTEISLPMDSEATLHDWMGPQKVDQMECRN